MNLAKLMLTGESENFRFLKPGALHKARWMAKLLYAMRIVLLSSKIEVVLPPGAVFEASMAKQRKCKETQLDKLKRFVQFVLVVCLPWWVTCGTATDAAGNDLLLLKVIASYHDIDSEVAKSAFQAFRGHPVTTAKPFSGHL